MRPIDFDILNVAHNFKDEIPSSNQDGQTNVISLRTLSSLWLALLFLFQSNGAFIY